MERSKDLINLRAEQAAVRHRIETGRLTKSSKESLLSRLRRIEEKLGIEGYNYNSSEF